MADPFWRSVRLSLRLPPHTMVRSHFLALRTLSLAPDIRLQAPVVQTSDSAIHRINHYPADSVIDFRNTYPLDSALSGG